MKLVHTSLGTLVSKKKIIASVAALALVGGIAPALIKNTHADGPVMVVTPTVFTTVGPNYFTVISDYDLAYYNDNGYDVHVADTSIADFYTEDMWYYTDSSHNTYGRCGDFKCLQGKKVGETEIVMEKSGEATIRFNLKSVELTPKAYNVAKLGEKVTVTGSLEGADNSMLQITNIESYEVSSNQTGERSAIIDSSSVTEFDNPEAIIDWQIGSERVGGGTWYEFFPIEGVDNIYHLPENEEVLENAVLSLMESIYGAYDYPSIGDEITTGDGSTFHFTGESTFGSYGHTDLLMIQGLLDSNDENITEDAKNKLAAELPEGSDVKFQDLEVSAQYYLKPWHTQRSASKDGSRDLDDDDYDDSYYEAIGYFSNLSEPLTMVLDVSDVEDEVAEGYTRKWYVVRDNDGEIEKLEADFDEDTNTIRFNTKVFGLHAYAYVDEETEGEEEQGKEEGESTPAPAVPNTGVAPAKVATTAIATILPLLGISVIAFMIRSKKNVDSKLAKKHNHFE